MVDRMAPAGKVWLCLACGKTATDIGGSEGGWDEGCALNCIAVDATTRTPTAEQVREFTAQRNRRLEALSQRMRDFGAAVRDDTYEPDPELLKLADEVLARRAGGAPDTAKDQG